MEKLKIICVFMILGLIFSCQKSSIPIKPEILTATYEIKTHSEFERGYHVNLEMKYNTNFNSFCYIILNRKVLDRLEVTWDSSTITINQYFPIQSQFIQNFEAPINDNRENGVVFGSPDNQHYFPIKFKLKKK